MLRLILIVAFLIGSTSCKRPNVLFIIVDDLRPSLECYGDKEAVTPNINKLASKSFVFKNAFAQQALCAPSRNSLLTSRRPDSLHLYDFHNYWRDTVGNFTTIPQYFKENGYYTYSIGKVFHPGSTSNFTDDSPYSWSTKSFHPKTDTFINAKVCIGKDGKLHKNLICPVATEFQPYGTLPDLESLNEAIRFLKYKDEITQSKPYFLAVGFHKPHIPFKFPLEFLKFHPIENITLPVNRRRSPTLPTVTWSSWIDIRWREDIKQLNVSFPFGPMPDETIKKIKQAYYSSVTYIDDLVGKLMKFVKRNTIIVFTSDHGWSIGEHGEFSKYNNYDVATKVPLLIRVPGLSEREVIFQQPVELVDVFPTLVDLTQISSPLKTCPLKKVDITCTEGKSLIPHMVSKIKGKEISHLTAFTQYPRSGVFPSIHPNSDEPKLNEIKIMGYSLRNEIFRYTEWVEFSTETFKPNWNVVYGRELYNHVIDTDENINLVDRAGLRNITSDLRKKLILGWRYVKWEQVDSGYTENMIARNKITFLVQISQNGIMSQLPNALGNKRSYSMQINCSKKRIPLRNNENLGNFVRNLGSGVVKSPLGEVESIPNENLVEYVFKKADQWSEETAVTCGATGRNYSFTMLRFLVNRFAQAVLGHCGMQPREVVGLLLPNIPEFVIVCHGAIEAGLVVTFVNPLYTPDELKRQFENAGVKMIITVPLLLEVATTIAPSLPGYRTTICIGGEDDVSKNIHGLESLLRAGHESELPGLNPKELTLLPYSSGTTGLPKGVMLSHYNLVSNLFQGDRDDLVPRKTKSGDRQQVLSVLPFFHIFGFNGILNVALSGGAHLITLPRFTPEDYAKALETYRPTFLFVVPSLLQFLASHPAITKDHLSSVEGIQSGAAPLTEAIIQKFRAKVDDQDISIRQGYGMTESSPVTFIMPRITPPSKIGTIGIPYPGTHAKIISLKTGETLGTNEPGELLIKGPQVMMGYLNNDEATAETLDEDGWLHTGDVAYYDEDAFFYIIDRCKELIKVKGNQVSPTELESLILEIEGILDAAVVGVPDTLAGEVPKAYVVRKPGANVNEEDIQRWVNGKVTNYKKLVGGVKFIDAIPRNLSGKILRNELKLN
ncbi:plipastatin synthase subunit A [Diorhabda carinulata]|uniref:plipastatin synthase subunit A n=1 Tax=Diorhabda carinulata TaxID=1163345 RepID=UPI0025A01326|nr:plipastatin synthase subunit A [Diorhabda carinulata]